MINDWRTLNDEQKKAVFTDSRYAVVYAGPGSGKTLCLAMRIADLLEKEKATPSEILAMAFTNKAANELRARISWMLEKKQIPSGGMTAGTFHSFCMKILHTEIESIPNYSKNFSVLSSFEQKSVILQILSALQSEMNVKDAISAISRWKNNLCSESDKNIFEDGSMLPQILSKYRSSLINSNVMDYDDILVLTYKLLSENEEIRNKYASRYKYIFIDEFQDTNLCQYEIMRLLAGEQTRLMVIGDSDQSIYGFRGGDMRNVRRFLTDYPEAEQIVLKSNYRSSDTIVRAASAVINHNKTRKEKENISVMTGDKKNLIEVYEAQDDQTQAELVVQKIIRMKKVNPEMKYGECAVFARMNYQLESVQTALEKHGIKCQPVSDSRIMEKVEIAGIISYLKLLNNPNDMISLHNLINIPDRKIGKETESQLSRISRTYSVSRLDILSSLAEDQQGSEYFPFFDDDAAEKLGEIGRLYQKWDGLLSKGMDVSNLLKIMMADISYQNYLVETFKKNAQPRIMNVNWFINYAGNSGCGFCGLSELLSKVSTVSDFDVVQETDDAVFLSTIHTAKGLEFDTVFIISANEKSIPHYIAMKTTDCEEERRLFYTAMTRAENRLIISYLRTTPVKKKTFESQNETPSRFIDEIPEELKQTQRVNFDICPYCEEKCLQYLIEEKKDVEIRNEMVPGLFKYFQCSKCLENHDLPRSEYDPYEIIYAQYRQRKGMMQPYEIRQRREAAGIGIEQMAQRSGVDSRLLSMYERGSLQTAQDDAKIKNFFAMMHYSDDEEEDEEANEENV